MKHSLETTRLEKIVSKITFKGAWDSILKDMNNDVLLSGKPLDTITLLGNIRKIMIAVGIIIIPLSIFLLEFSPVFIGLNMIWIMIFAFPKLHQTNLSQDRRKKVEEELPTFAIFASVMQNVGINLYQSFQLFREMGFFKAIGQEALLLKRNVEYFGLSQMEALEELGRTHKSEHFRNLLLGYTSIWRSGGDLSFYLENRAEEFFVFLKDRYQTYSNNIGTVVEILVTLLIILPIMIMVVAFVLPGSSLEQIALFSTIGLPIFAILMGVITASIQPANFNTIGLSQNKLAIVAGIGMGSAIATYLMTNELWMTILVGIVLPSTISALITGRHHHEINKLEQSLQQFLRDMTEYKKIGYDVILAIFRLSEENLYNSVFNKKLNELKMLLDSGTTPTTSVKAIEFRSWFTKISFFLIAYIAEYGGGNPKTLETVNRFISNARQAIREGKASISALTLIIFGAPVIMAFTAAMILNIMGSVDASAFEGFQSQQGSQLGFEQNLTKLVMVTPEFVGMINVLIVTSSILGAFVITKAIDFTFYNTWRVVVLGLIAAASVLFIDNFGSINLDSFSDSLPF